MREKLYLISKFSSDRTSGFRWSKKKSASPQQELQEETGSEEFRQTPRGMGFYLTWFNPCLRVILMVRVFGAGTATHCSPKDLGLNAGFFGLF